MYLPHPHVACCSLAAEKTQPESPRYELMNGRHNRAFQSLASLRRSNVQAARDLFYMHTLLKAESLLAVRRTAVKEMFTVGRNRRALVASEVSGWLRTQGGDSMLMEYRL